MIINVVFSLCALVGVFCWFMLTRAYLKRRNRLLLWCAICFGLLACNSIFVCVDMILFPTVDLAGPFLRHLVSAAAGMILLIGLITELA